MWEEEEDFVEEEEEEAASPTREGTLRLERLLLLLDFLEELGTFD